MAKKRSLKREKGNIEVICGPMYSGKSEEMLRRLMRLDYGEVKYLCFKPSIDTRDKGFIKSRNGSSKEAILVNSSEEILQKVLELDKNDEIDAIAIDEVQFFTGEEARKIVEIAEILAQHNYLVILAGLDKDFRGEAFESIPLLMSVADKVTKLTAICKCCGAEAGYSQRLVEGKPARYNDPLIMVGNDEYQPRCRFCFRILGKKKSETSKLFEQTKL